MKRRNSEKILKTLNDIKRTVEGQKNSRSSKRETAKGRVKFTTMLHPGMRSILASTAMNERQTISDALEYCLMQYFSVTPKDLDIIAKAGK